MKNSLSKKLILGLSAIFFLIIIYEVLHLAINNDFIVPSFFAVIKAGFKIVTTKTSLLILLKTFLKIFFIILICFIITLIVGFIYFKFRSVLYFCRPIISLIKAIPFAIVAVYLFIVLYSQKRLIPYIVVMLVILPIIQETVFASVDNISTSLVDELKMLEGSEIKKYLYIYLPMIAPYLLVAFLQSVGLGIKSLIMAEYIASVDNTIGDVINNAKLNVDFETVLGWLLVIIVIVFIIDLAVEIITKKILKNVKSI